jgi:hypothetical protein
MERSLPRQLTGVLKSTGVVPAVPHATLWLIDFIAHWSFMHCTAAEAVNVRKSATRHGKGTKHGLGGKRRRLDEEAEAPDLTECSFKERTTATLQSRYALLSWLLRPGASRPSKFGTEQLG